MISSPGMAKRMRSSPLVPYASAEGMAAKIFSKGLGLSAGGGRWK